MKIFGKAADYCQKSYDLSDANANYANLIIICDCLVKSYSETGESSKIPEYFALYQEAKDTLTNIDKARDRTTLLLETEFDQERKETELQQQVVLAEQKTIRTGLIIGLSALALLAFFIFRSNRNKAKANALLTEKNEQISKQNEQISEQKQALEKSNYTKDRIFAILGHDLRKPAISFQGLARKVNYLLKKEDYDRIQALGESIESSALGLTSLTDNLLKWALAQKDAISIKPEALNINDLINETKLVLGRLAEAKNIEIISEIPSSTEIQADKNSMLTILRNLVDNAIKYTPEGGKITLSAKESNAGIDLYIKDTGIGISKEKTETIFLLQDGKSTQGTG
ncbi:MAG: sensor histidine kinase, partial [Saprospiraceae bacterium]